MRALSIKQPWAGAIARLGKDVENRSWTTCQRGPFAVHASVGMGRRLFVEDAVGRVAELSGRPAGEVWPLTEVRGAVVAVARLNGVCAESRSTRALHCSCGVWAVPGQFHFRLTDVVPLAAPVPVTGRLGLWHLPADVEAAVMAQAGGS